MPRRKKKESERGGGLAPKTKLKIGPDRRAQAVLRAAERPKDTRVRNRRGITTTSTTIKNPGVGVEATKDTRAQRGVKGTQSILGFNRYKPGEGGAPNYDTKADRNTNGRRPRNTAHSLHKDRLRSAAVKHAMGRHMTDIRPGSKVGASTAPSKSGKNPRGRAYQQQTKGALNYERGKQRYAETTKLTKTSWQPSNTKKPVTFNPNDLKNALKAMAKGTIVRATSKLIGGPIAQGAIMIDDAVAAATQKRPSKEIAKKHSKTQSKLIKELQKRKQKQAPWAGSGPF